MNLRLVILASCVFAALAIATPTQWDWRIRGSISVRMDAITTAAFERPAVTIRIERVSPEWYEPGKIAVALRSRTAPTTLGSLPASVQSILSHFGVRTAAPYLPPTDVPIVQARSVGLERVVIVWFDPGFDPFDVAAALMESPDVEYATPLYIRRGFLQPNDPQLGQQYAINRMQLPAAWDITTGSTSVTIAIIDSGTDYEHEDLAGNLWTNPGETGTDAQGRDKRTNGVDDDGNGKIDDWRGWDFIGNVTRAEYLAGTVREDNDPKIRATTIPAEMQHGTNTAGAAAAVTNNGRGIASPAFQCRYIPIKCGSDDASLAGSVLRGYDAILYAARLGATIINCSWGGPGGSPLEQQIIDQACALGSFLVVASGNDGINLDRQPYYPASYHGVFTIGASTASDAPASFSNYGSIVAAYAPGAGIRTTMVNNAYTTVDGTSFAAPLASGVAALLRSLHPEWSLDQVAAQLRYSCDPLSGVSQNNRPLYYGRINAYRALAANRSFTSGMRFPGVQLVGLSVDGAAAITSTESQTLNLRLRNLLAPASTVRLTITVSSNAMLGQTTLTTSSLGTLEERTLSTTLRLTTPVYFYDGSVQLRITITADSITDYASVELPIELPMQNTYTRLATNLPYTFIAIATRGLSGVWAVGRSPLGRAVVYRSTGNVIDTTSLSGTLTTLGIASNTVVCIGTSAGQIHRTTDGGSSWRATSVSAITPSVQGIIFFDASRGVCIGLPSSGSWRLGRTSDGGATWQAAEQLPTPRSGERTMHAAITSLGDTLWIGTSAGRILRSSDRGATWTASDVASGMSIVSVTFSSSTLGYCLLQPSSGQQTMSIYRTTDGGITWTPVGSPMNNPLPVALYAPFRSRYLFAMCSGSQVLRSTDSAATWEPVLTGNGGCATAFVGTTAGQNATLYLAGQTIASLRVSIAQGGPILRTTPSDTLDFGTVRLDSSATRILTISNTGQSVLSITGATVDALTASPDEFQLVTALPLSIGASSSQTLTIRFQPRSAGERRSLLRLQTNATPAEHAIILRGIATMPSTVPTSDHTPACAPIQRGQELAVECPCTDAGEFTLELWSLSGTQLLSHTSASGPLLIQQSTLPSGVYAYRLRCQDETYFCGTILLVH
ncbi:MAG: hypothetical protein KatS3mg040_1826 [Candidatus Kapaibacterium sp.]|nr:MAG: hypothetical protein KatS3mg040_1826 [Candidatus Kapabacteria bacterium]